MESREEKKYTESSFTEFKKEVIPWQISGPICN